VAARPSRSSLTARRDAFHVAGMRATSIPKERATPHGKLDPSTIKPQLMRVRNLRVASPSPAVPQSLKPAAMMPVSGHFGTNHVGRNAPYDADWIVAWRTDRRYRNDAGFRSPFSRNCRCRLHGRAPLC
jgi:hypothetical protein